jgi:hypothetical protein
MYMEPSHQSPSTHSSDTTRPPIGSTTSLTNQKVTKSGTQESLGFMADIKKIGPRIIFLSGTSTAGKSSIMSAFAKLENNAIELGTDDFEEARCATLIKTHFPAEHEVLSKAVDDKNLYRFIYSPPDDIKARPELYFRESITPLQMKEREAVIVLNESATFFTDIDQMLRKAKSTQDNEHFETILSKSREGKTVIFDSPNVNGFFEYLQGKPHDAPIQRFLVYVPLTELVKRLPGRNEQSEKTGNLPNKRQYIDLLNQFKNLYRKAEGTDIRVDTLKREDIDRIFSENETEINSENSSAIERGRIDYAVDKEEFLKYFGFEPSDLEVQIGLPPEGLEKVHITKTEIQRFDGLFRAATQPAVVTAHQLSIHTWEKL